MKPKQLELLELMLAHPMMTDLAMAEIMDLNPKTVSKWRKLPEF